MAHTYGCSVVNIEGCLSEINLIDKVLSEINGLISLPEVYLKFRQLMDDSESTLADLTQTINCDPNLTALVLKFVNSPLYGYAGRINNVSDAIRILGTDKLHNIVLASSVMALDYPNDIVPLKTFWRGSLFSGIFASMLGRQLGIYNSEDLFVVGLLHEIGHLIIYSKYPMQAKKSIIRVGEDSQSIHIAEQSILGFHYGHVGAKLMAIWLLPLDFQIITYFQPTPLDAPTLHLKTALLHIAHNYAYQYISGNVACNIQAINPEIWRVVGGTTDQIDSIYEQAKIFCLDMESTIFR
jgi:HD-like signal output (HDOD) protein